MARKKWENNKYTWGYGEIETLIHCWWKIKNDAVTLENSLAVPQRLNLELPYNPLIPLPGMYQSEIKIHCHTKTCTWMHWLEMNCQISLQQTWVYLGLAENYTSGPEAMVSCEPVTPEQAKEVARENDVMRLIVKKSLWFFTGWVLAGKEASFFLFGFAIIAGCESSPLWSPDSNWGFCFFVLFCFGFFANAYSNSFHNSQK